MHLAFTFGGTPGSLNFVFYVVEFGKLFIMESDAVTTATPLLNGVVCSSKKPRGDSPTLAERQHGKFPSLGYPMRMDLVCPSGGRIAHRQRQRRPSLTTTKLLQAPNSVTGAARDLQCASDGRASIAIGGYSSCYLVNSNQASCSSRMLILFGFGEPRQRALQQ